MAVHPNVPDATPVQAVLLAAGAGRRMGVPKALLRDSAGRALVSLQVDKLRQAAALVPSALAPDPVVVVGARADEVVAQLPSDLRFVHCQEWARGMGESLKSGLQAVDPSAAAVLVMLVDLVDVPPEAIARVAAADSAVGSGARGASGRDLAPGVLARATWNGVPGHPVLIGRDHLPAAIAASHDDVGARDLFRSTHPSRSQQVHLVECGDLVCEGRDGSFDIDTPEQAAARGFYPPSTHPPAAAAQEGRNP